MATIEERLAFLEGRVGEHSRAIAGVHDAIVQLDRRIQSLEDRMDRRFEALETKLDQRFAVTDQKIDQRTDALDQKFSRQFAWVVGIQVTTLVAMVGALLAR